MLDQRGFASPVLANETKDGSTLQCEIDAI